MASHLFIYGTLRKQAHNSQTGLLQPGTRPVGPARMAGQLLDLGDYPGLVPAAADDQWVRGEVYELLRPAEVLRRLDEYEGCTETGPAPAPFRRRLGEAELDDGRRLRAWVYEYTGPRLRARSLPSGDYLQTNDHGLVHIGAALTPLGRIWVAATERGLCALAFGEDASEIETRVRALFPERLSVFDQPGIEPMLRGVLECIEHPANARELPVDLRGTPFQKVVWQELRRIPPGETISYAELARRIGQPKAVRAVAGACGANPVALVVPCHRVVRSDGTLGGFGWGLERKRALLEREGCAIP